MLQSLNFKRLILRKVLQFRYFLIINIRLVLKSQYFLPKKVDLLLLLFCLHQDKALIVKCQSEFLYFFVHFSISVVIFLHALQFRIQGLKFPIKSRLLDRFCLIFSLESLDVLP